MPVAAEEVTKKIRRAIQQRDFLLASQLIMKHKEVFGAMEAMRMQQALLKARWGKTAVLSTEVLTELNKYG